MTDRAAGTAGPRSVFFVIRVTSFLAPWRSSIFVVVVLLVSYARFRLARRVGRSAPPMEPDKLRQS
jgi:hypothetical protein